VIRFWKIDADHAVHETDMDGWIAWMMLEAREDFETLCRVAQTQIDGDCWISTVFLFMSPGDQPRFETMVFGGDHDKRIRRYATWDEAAAGHAAIVDEVMGRVGHAQNGP
jgi:hypothetical protein